MKPLTRGPPLTGPLYPPEDTDGGLQVSGASSKVIIECLLRKVELRARINYYAWNITFMYRILHDASRAGQTERHLP